MKKILFAMFTALSLMFASCGDDDEEKEDDLIIDWSPIKVKFFVVSYGQQINYVANNFNDIIHTTTLTYRGKTYSIEKSLSKFYAPNFQGLHIDSTAVWQPFFCFGELDGSNDYDDDFVIDFADGSKDVIHFTRKHMGGLKVKDTWTLNGKERNGDSFILYRQEQDGKLVSLHLDWE